MSSKRCKHARFRRIGVPDRALRAPFDAFSRMYVHHVRTCTTITWAAPAPPSYIHSAGMQAAIRRPSYTEATHVYNTGYKKAKGVV